MSDIEDDSDSLFDPEEEEAEAFARANPVPVIPRKRGTKNWREGPLTFDSFESFSNWRKASNTFLWARTGHSKSKITISSDEIKYDWYTFQCKSHAGCQAAVSMIAYGT